MDLYAYSQIDSLDKIAEANGIFVPRLRGYRLMVDEPPLTYNAIYEAIRDQEIFIYERACISCPRFRPDSDMSELSSATDRMKRKYLIRENNETVGIRWDLIHGKNRKALKYALKKKSKGCNKAA